MHGLSLFSYLLSSCVTLHVSILLCHLSLCKFPISSFLYYCVLYCIYEYLRIPVCKMWFLFLPVFFCFCLLYVNNHILIYAYTCTCILSCVFSLQILSQSFAIYPVLFPCKLFLNFFYAVIYSFSLCYVLTENYFKKNLVCLLFVYIHVLYSHCK